MNTSELIAALQKINKSVPFDADIVVEGDIYPQSVIGVRHEPPHTFLVLEGENDPYQEIDSSFLTDDEFQLIQTLRNVAPEDRRFVGNALADALRTLQEKYSTGTD